MKAINPDILRLQDMLQAIEDIEGYGFFSDNDKKTMHAISYNFTIIGEAAGRLSDTLKQQNPQISWPQIIGIRNKLVHEYRKTNAAIMDAVIQEHLPILKIQLADILLSLNTASSPTNAT